MKAVVYSRYGSPDVVRVTDVAPPVPGGKDVVVRVHATVVSAADVAFRSGKPFSVRLIFGLLRPRPGTAGAHFAGQVEAVGADVTRFREGDRVVGAVIGTHMEYVCVPEDAALAPMPDNLTYGEAIAVYEGVLTALPFLRDEARLRAGQSVLVNGAAGAVGTAAVQLAKHFGAHVTGVCGTANIDLVRSLGADEVIDYTKEDFTRTGRTYDVVFDAVGKSSFRRCRRLLRPGGVYMTTVPSLAILLQMLWTSKLGKRRALIAFTGLRKPAEKAKDMRFLKELAETGKFQPVIDSIHPLDRIADAHARVDTGHKRGSVVVTLDDD